MGTRQGYGDDSAEIQKSNGGVPTVNLVVPMRYTRARNRIMSRENLDQMVELVLTMIKKLDANEVKRSRDFATDGR